MFAEQIVSPVSDTAVMVLAVCGVVTLIINAIFGPLVTLYVARMSVKLTDVKALNEAQVEKIEKQEKKLDAIKEINEVQNDKIDTIANATNGLKNELVQATKSGALAEGKLAGIAEERAKVDEKK